MTVTQPKSNRRNIIMNKRRYTSIPNMIMLSIDIKSCCWPKCRVRCGDPASPSAAAVPINAMIAIVLNPKAMLSGTKIDAIIGIVANDEPIPIVTIKPTSNITKAAIPLLSPSIADSHFQLSK